MLTPVMSVTMLVLSASWEQLPTVLPSSPYFATMKHTMETMLIIFLGAVLAFLMVRF